MGFWRWKHFKCAKLSCPGSLHPRYSLGLLSSFLSSEVNSSPFLAHLKTCFFRSTDQLNSVFLVQLPCCAYPTPSKPVEPLGLMHVWGVVICLLLILPLYVLWHHPSLVHRCIIGDRALWCFGILKVCKEGQSVCALRSNPSHLYSGFRERIYNLTYCGNIIG